MNLPVLVAGGADFLPSLHLSSSRNHAYVNRTVACECLVAGTDVAVPSAALRQHTSSDAMVVRRTRHQRTHATSLAGRQAEAARAPAFGAPPRAPRAPSWRRSWRGPALAPLSWRSRHRSPPSRAPRSGVRSPAVRYLLPSREPFGRIVASVRGGVVWLRLLLYACTFGFQQQQLASASQASENGAGRAGQLGRTA